MEKDCLKWNHRGCEWQRPKKIEVSVWWRRLGHSLEEKRRLEGGKVELASSPSWPPSGAVDTRPAAFRNERLDGDQASWDRDGDRESQSGPHSLWV